MEAEISVMGSPLKHFGVREVSILERTPAKRTIARRKPRPTPRDEIIDSRKSYPAVMLLRVTPRTAQLVVIRGRYTPRDL